MRILIVEDSPAIASNLYDYLESLGHNVDAACDGITALNLATSIDFDAILLDLGLPRMDGISLCKKLRSEYGLTTPILMLTARYTLEDKLRGFEIGADDYLAKPFALEEVAARLKALHARHIGRSITRSVVVKNLSFDPTTMKAKLNGVNLDLTPKCLLLLEIFINAPGQLISRKTLEVELWGEQQETSERLRHHLHLLRREFKNISGKNMIVNVHGLGYRLDLHE